MSVQFGNAFIISAVTWQQFKNTVNTNSSSVQYDDDGTQYTIFAVDSPLVYVTYITKGTVPDAPGYSQAQNDSNKADFENNFKSRCNLPVKLFDTGDDRWVYRLGNMTSTSSLELLVSTNGYFEQQSQGQRAVVSTSASDANPAGAGAKAVRITFLNSNYQKKIEDVNLNGTTAVATVNTDIRFIEKFEVIKGTAAVGKITLTTGSTGLGEICSIGAATTDAFLCHHYIPSGSKAEVIEWSVTVSDDANMKLKAQRWFSGSLVDPIFLDLDNMVGIASGSRSDLSRTFRSVPLQEKTYVRITSTAGQASQTTVRARLNVWEDALYVSGSG